MITQKKENMHAPHQHKTHIPAHPPLDNQTKVLAVCHLFITLPDTSDVGGSEQTKLKCYEDCDDRASSYLPDGFPGMGEDLSLLHSTCSLPDTAASYTDDDLTDRKHTYSWQGSQALWDYPLEYEEASLALS